MKMNRVRALLVIAAALVCLGCDSPVTYYAKKAEAARDAINMENAVFARQLNAAVADGSYVVAFRTTARSMMCTYYDENNMERSERSAGSWMIYHCPQPVRQQRANLTVIWGDAYMQYLPAGEFTHTIEVYFNRKLVDRVGKVGVAESYARVNYWGN